MQDKTNVIELREVLHFFKAAGVEDAVTETPRDAFAATEKAAKRAEMQQASANHVADKLLQKTVNPAPPSNPDYSPAQQIAAQPLYSQRQGAPARPKPQSVHTSHEEWLNRAKIQARSAQSLGELKARIAAFDGCNLKFTAKSTCIADGTEPRALMLIGEGPGAEEDRQALPFVGRAGQLLNLILAAIGFSRESLQQAGANRLDTGSAHIAAAGIQAAASQLAYITNAVFWRPPGNRTPTLQEIELCRPFLERQIELVRPKMIISLGGVAAAALLGQKQSILRLRGYWRIYKTTDGREILYMPSLHPAFLLRSPLQKKAAWQDFLAAKMRLKELGTA